MMAILTFLVNCSGVACLFASVYLLIFKRKDNGKLICECGAWGVIVCLNLLNQILS